MKIIVFLCSTALLAVAPLTSAQGDEKYSRRYDNIDVNTIFRSSRLLNNYVDCLLDKKPCPPEGKDLKRVLPDALKTRCSQCTEVQKAKALDVIKRLYYDHPKTYLALAERYDPTGEYTRNFENWYDEQNVVRPRPPAQAQRIPSTWITSSTTPATIYSTQRSTTARAPLRTSARTAPPRVQTAFQVPSREFESPPDALIAVTRRPAPATTRRVVTTTFRTTPTTRIFPTTFRPSTFLVPLPTFSEPRREEPPPVSAQEPSTTYRAPPPPITAPATVRTEQPTRATPLQTVRTPPPTLRTTQTEPPFVPSTILFKLPASREPTTPRIEIPQDFVNEEPPRVDQPQVFREPTLDFEAPSRAESPQVIREPSVNFEAPPSPEFTTFVRPNSIPPQKSETNFRATVQPTTLTQFSPVREPSVVFRAPEVLQEQPAPATRRPVQQNFQPNSLIDNFFVPNRNGPFRRSIGRIINTTGKVVSNVAGMLRTTVGVITGTT